MFVELPPKAPPPSPEPQPSRKRRASDDAEAPLKRFSLDIHQIIRDRLTEGCCFISDPALFAQNYYGGQIYSSERFKRLVGDVLSEESANVAQVAAVALDITAQQQQQQSQAPMRQ